MKNSKLFSIIRNKYGAIKCPCLTPCSLKSYQLNPIIKNKCFKSCKQKNLSYKSFGKEILILLNCMKQKVLYFVLLIRF